MNIRNHINRTIAGIGMLAMTSLVAQGILPVNKAEARQNGAQTLVVNAKDALTGGYADNVKFVAYDPATADSINAGTTNPSGYTEILLTSPMVAVYTTTWGGIKSMFGENPQQAQKTLEAKVASMYDLRADPWLSVDVEGTSVQYTKIRETLSNLNPEANAYNPWMIKDQTIAFPYGSVDKLVEMLKNLTLTSESDQDKVVEGSYWPIKIVGWAPTVPPSGWTSDQLNNWKQSWQDAETAWESMVGGLDLIYLVPNEQTPTIGTVWHVLYTPGGNETVIANEPASVGGFYTGGNILIGAGLANDGYPTRLCYAEHVFGHTFGLYDINNDHYLMEGTIGTRTVTQDEADIVKIIHNIAPKDMSKYPTPE